MQLAASLPPTTYVVAVEDGSVREPLLISDITDAGISGEVVVLVRNVGHQRAIACGLVYVASEFTFDALVVMDSDGEDDPSTIAPLLRVLESGSFDIAVAQRRQRPESIGFRVFYVLYRLLFQLCTGRKIRFGNFAVLNRRAVQRLASMQELWVHFAASLMVSRLRIKAVATDRGKRYVGQSRMNFVSLLLHGFRAIMVFAEDVLVRVGLLCVVLASMAIMLLFATTALKLIGFATPGWFSTASGLLILILLQAGVLTFVTLMVAGVVRSASSITRTQVDLLIERIDKGQVAPDTIPRRAFLKQPVSVKHDS
jgi:hypothetical protein